MSYNLKMVSTGYFKLILNEIGQEACLSSPKIYMQFQFDVIALVLWFDTEGPRLLAS